jgi:tetratricopeptide (TPR) repeat protein
LMRTRQYTSAAAEYRKARDFEPKNTFSFIMEAVALVKLGRYPDALSVLEKAHSTSPTDADVDNALARLLSAAPADKLRDGPRAVELMHEVVAHQGSADLDQAQTIAMALAETGQFQKAADIQRKVIEAAQGESSGSRIADLRETLNLYEQGRACRTPWPDDDPIFVPTPEKQAEGTTDIKAGPSGGD